jgi:hypothetical protein
MTFPHAATAARRGRLARRKAGHPPPTPWRSLLRWRVGASVAATVLVAAVPGTAGCGGGNAQLGFSPQAGTPAASAQTQISVRGVKPSDIRAFSVSGSTSGRHSGRLMAHPEGAGTSFLPDEPFDPGETVDVRIRADGKNWRLGFTVARPATTTVEAGPPGKPTKPGQVESFHSRPDLHPPTVTVTAQSPGTSAGDIFLTPINVFGQAGPLIVDARGQPVWFQPTPGKEQAFNFGVQRYEDRPVLTWWQGVVSSRGYGVGEDVIANGSYRESVLVKAGNGYRADMHDFLVTPQGTALLLIYDPLRADLSSIGGPRDGEVMDTAVQELDIRTGLVLFEWHSLGSVGVDESYAGKPQTGVPYDYFHLNSVDVDSDGNLLISARNTWAIYKINRKTGHIMWRLGGKRSSFEMGRGTRFAYQHDARRQPDGTITLFDNGADPAVKEQSRAIALKLDTQTMRATLAREWTHPGRLLAGSQGNMQTLPNGDRFVGWGAQPNVTEFNPAGNVLFDAAFAPPAQSYRAYRFRWSATPAGRPAIATTEADGKVTVYASWNGATDVARWRILAGTTPQNLAPVADAGRTGFETAVAVPAGAAYFAVEAQAAAGRDLGESSAVKPGAASEG